MKKLYDAMQRFCALHPRFGIPNLMIYVVAGNAIIFLLGMFTLSNPTALDFLFLDTGAVLRGEVWRVVTYVFVPTSGGMFWLLISMYFYYWIGSTLERQWGTAKFTLYYVSGTLLTALGAILASLITGHNYVVAGATYVNLSMFLAFACLFPYTQVLLMFIIPVKMKWLAILDGALFAYDILTAAIARNWGGVVMPLVALLNFFVFIYPEVRYFTQRQAARHNPKTVQFKKAVQQQQKQQGYHHKCAVCGRTDSQHPELEFRYCSKCAGYHCFCMEHIFSHVHFTEE